MSWTKEDYNKWATDRRPWEAGDIQYLKLAYGDPDSPVNIQAIADKLGRSFNSVALKASRLGLGNHSRPTRPEVSQAQSKTQKENWAKLTPEESREKSKQLVPFQGTSFLGKKHTSETKEILSKLNKERIKAFGHNRGMLGKHHSEETKKKISRFNFGKKIPREQTVRRLKTSEANKSNPKNRSSCSWKSQWVTIGGQTLYARSLWEANYARYLEFLKGNGEILGWQHEPDTFWFDAVKRGCVSYLPDFKVTQWTGHVEYHEVKGWMDARSKTKIKRMARYFPSVTLIVIDSERYKSLSRNAKFLVPGWETNTSSAKPRGDSAR